MALTSAHLGVFRVSLSVPVVSSAFGNKPLELEGNAGFSKPQIVILHPVILAGNDRTRSRYSGVKSFLLGMATAQLALGGENGVMGNIFKRELVDI